MHSHFRVSSVLTHRAQRSAHNSQWERCYLCHWLAADGRAVSATDWITDRYERCGAPAFRQTDEWPHFFFRRTKQRRQHAAQAFCATSEQQVLHGWVQRRATDDGWTTELRVGNREVFGIEAKHQDHRRFMQVIGEMICSS